MFPYYVYIPGICYAQSTGSDRANLGSELCAIILGSRTQTSDLRICCANLGSARNHLGSRNQTSAIRGNKSTIDRARKAARPSAATWVHCRGWPSCFACTIDRGFVDADGRAALRARSIAASLPHDGRAALRARSIVASLTRMAELLCVRDRSRLLCRGLPNCFACAIDRGFVDADGRAALRA